MLYALRQRIKNFLSSSFFLVISYSLCTKYFFNRSEFGDVYSIPVLKINITILEIFRYIFFIYAIALFIIYFFARKAVIGKGVYAIKALRKILSSPIIVFEKGLSKEEKIGLLAILVKMFFTPLLISWFLANFSQSVLHTAQTLQSRGLLLSNFMLIFQQHLFFMFFNIILFVDVFFFTFGYLIELSIFKNKIISVEPTLLGWLVTLICYPPFNTYANRLIGWNSVDFPYFANPYLFLIINISILVLLGVYSWASLALGFKASNLTHRGIITHGPYRLIRHPAYVCKNLAWWLGGLTFIISAGHQGLLPFAIVILSLSSWSLIYFFRAMTEERHLKSVNSEYDEYIKKVPYRFIPFVL